MDAGIGAKATVLACIGGDGEGNGPGSVTRAIPAVSSCPQRGRVASGLGPSVWPIVTVRL